MRRATVRECEVRECHPWRGWEAPAAGVLRCRQVRIPFSIPPTGRQRFDVVGLGENSLDLLGVVAAHPAANSKQRLQRFARLPGGQIATALVTCARLGWRARYIGSFGADEHGALARDNLTCEHVDISATRTVAGATNQFALILVDARTGERTVLWDRHPGLTLEPKDLSKDDVTSGRVLLLDCHEIATVTEAAKYARGAGIPTVLDVEEVRPGSSDLLRHTDAIIATEEFPGALTGHQDLGRALEAMANEFSAPLVCATLGGAGSLARCDGREIRTPAYRVDCVDSTGAGDAFRGAFVAACLRAPQGSIEDVLEFANAVAALNCRALGARGGLPSVGEVENLLQAEPSRSM